MSVRGAYELQLAELKKEVLHMGEEVMETFSQSIDILRKNHRDAIAPLLQKDEKINEMELSIHDQVTLMIARQQPVATDLRMTIVALKVASDLERIGDLTVDILKATKRLIQGANELELMMLNEMADIALQMVKEAMEAYHEGDLLHAQQVASIDDVVDKKYKQFIKMLFTSTKDVAMEQAIQLAFIGRYVERVADHATNISEWVIYEKNGQHLDLN